MTPEIVFSESVIGGDSHKIREFLRDRNIPKFLTSIKSDPAFAREGDVLHYLGDAKKRRKKAAPARPLQLKMFQPLSSPPMFRNRAGHPVELMDMYRGATAFLLANGPSQYESEDTDLLYKPGILRMGLNNGPRLIRPHMWCCVDPPDKFLTSIWYDPTIMKFVGGGAEKKALWNSRLEQPVTDRVVGDCPNVFYVGQNTNFVPEHWMGEATFNWGNNESLKFEHEGLVGSGVRSVMLMAMKTLILLGVRTIYLFGADFHMDTKKPYGFDENKEPGAAQSNNGAYVMLNLFFKSLRSYFESIGCQVFNTNPKSGLRAFDFVPFEQAIEVATSEIGDTASEPTEGMYRSLKEKKAGMPPDRSFVDSGRWGPGKGFSDISGDLVTVIPPEPAPMGSEDAITVKELWLNRERFVAIYPEMADAVKTGEGLLNEMAARGSKCKGCTFDRCIRGYISGVFYSLKTKSAPFTASPFLDLDRPIVRGRKDVPLLREVVNGNSPNSK